MLKSVHYTFFLQRSVQLQIVLSIRSLCSLSTTVCDTMRNIVCQVALLSSFTGNLHCCKSLCSLPTIVRPQSVHKLYIRSLCSLSSLVICTVVSQVTVLPSSNSKATVSSLCSLPVPIYSNFIQFIWIFPEFICIFEWKERMWEHLGTWFISTIFPHVMQHTY